MYITWAKFQKLFPNVNVDEDTFDILNEVAEDLIYNYVGKKISSPKNDVGFAAGIIIQHIRALGLQPQDKNPFSAAGISSTPKDFNEFIPALAREILDRYRELM